MSHETEKALDNERGRERKKYVKIEARVQEIEWVQKWGEV